MGFMEKLRGWLLPTALLEGQVEKALVETKRKKPLLIDDSRATHLPLHPFVEPGGRGPRKILGVPFDILRAFAKNNPWLRAAIDIRKREIAAAQWDVVPHLEKEKAELDALKRLVLSAQRYPDRKPLVQAAKPDYIRPKIWTDLKAATAGDTLTPEEIRDRFMLAMFDLTRTAEQHAAVVRKLFLHPNRNRKPWDQILRAIVPDILTIDAGCIELRRALYPQDDNGRPQPDNAILEMHWVDGATVRPCIDEHGMLRGIENPTETAYEQWLDGQRVDDGGWRVGDLLYIQENPQTDVRFRGYGYSRVESLVMTSMLEGMADKGDLEGFKREFYGGFLNIKDKSFMMEDVDAFRFHIEEQLEGTKKIPITAFEDLQYVAANQNSSTGDAKTVEKRKQFQLRVCAVMNMPPVKLGIFENANYSTSETSQEISDDGLRELMDLLDEAITEGIVADFGYTDIAYRSNAAHLRDKPEELEGHKMRMELMLATPNEIRAEYGDPPIENGDQPLEYLKAYNQEKGKADAGGEQDQWQYDENEGDGDEFEDEDESGEVDENNAPQNAPDEDVEKALVLGFQKAIASHKKKYGTLPKVEIEVAE